MNCFQHIMRTRKPFFGFDDHYCRAINIFGSLKFLQKLSQRLLWNGETILGDDQDGNLKYQVGWSHHRQHFSWK